MESRSPPLRDSFFERLGGRTSTLLVSGSAYLADSQTLLSTATLRQLRERAGLTQVELARRLGIPVTVVSAYECGRRQPSLETAGRVIDALGFDVTFERRLDPEVQARKLVDVVELAEALPYRPRPLHKARW